VAHPILMERSVVAGPRGVHLCRPAERVREVLPAR
jgi:arsenate reductase-like glutaredoxin family protein